jgi:FkbM family methyltransferase
MFYQILKKVLMILPLSLIHISIIYVRVVEFFASKNISNTCFLRILNFIENKKYFIKCPDGKRKENFWLYTPNNVCEYRAKTFFTKEPEILDWIDKFGGNGSFFDIGSNIGLYSVYHALKYDSPVYSFEPSIFNLKQLIKNVSINELSERINIVPLALNNKLTFETFNVSNIQEGAASNAFGVDYGFDGNKKSFSFKYKTLGFTADLFSQILQITPSLIKIDVDGIEHLILEAMENTILSSEECRTVFVEVYDNFEKQAANVSLILRRNGFKLISKEQSDLFKHKSNATFNQIWLKS